MVAVNAETLDTPRVPWSRSRRWLTVAQVAAELGVSGPTLYRAVRAGEFPAVKVRGRYVVPARVLEELERVAIDTSGLVKADEVTVQVQPLGRRDRD